MLSLTDKAIEKVKEIIQQQGKTGHALRVYVAGGGCSGLQYGLTFTDAHDNRDSTASYGEFEVLVDPISYQYLSGASVDYVETLMGGGFKIENPNAMRTCGCGSSFSA